MTPPHRGSGGERQGSEHTGKRLDPITTSTAAKFQPAPMTVYDGRTAIGEIEDHGPRRIIAFDLTPTGRVSLGQFPDRRSAIRAVSVLHPPVLIGSGKDAT
jgi:hypothetical protein